MELGRRIRDARQSVGLSQGQACYGICDRTYLSKIENGALTPPADLLHLLADRLRAHDLTLALAATRHQARLQARQWLHRTRRLPPDEPTLFQEGYRHWWAVREPHAPPEFHTLTARLLASAPSAAAAEPLLVPHWLTEAYRFYRWRPYRDFLLAIGLERLGQQADRRRFGQVDAEGRELLAHLSSGAERAGVAAALMPVVLARHGGPGARALCHDVEDAPFWWEALTAPLASAGPTGRPLAASLRAVAAPLVDLARPPAWRRQHPAEYAELLLVGQRMARLAGASQAARRLTRARAAVLGQLAAYDGDGPSAP